MIIYNYYNFLFLCKLRNSNKLNRYVHTSTTTTNTTDVIPPKEDLPIQTSNTNNTTWEFKPQTYEDNYKRLEELELKTNTKSLHELYQEHLNKQDTENKPKLRDSTSEEETHHPTTHDFPSTNLTNETTNPRNNPIEITPETTQILVNQSDNIILRTKAAETVAVNLLERAGMNVVASQEAHDKAKARHTKLLEWVNSKPRWVWYATATAVLGCVYYTIKTGEVPFYTLITGGLKRLSGGVESAAKDNHTTIVNLNINSEPKMLESTGSIIGRVARSSNPLENIPTPPLTLGNAIDNLFKDPSTITLISIGIAVGIWLIKKRA